MQYTKWSYHHNDEFTAGRCLIGKRTEYSTLWVEIPLLLVSAAAADKRKINWVCAAGALLGAHGPSEHPADQHPDRPTTDSLFHLQKCRRRTNGRRHRAPDSGGKAFVPRSFDSLTTWKGHTRNKNCAFARHAGARSGTWFRRRSNK